MGRLGMSSHSVCAVGLCVLTLSSVAFGQIPPQPLCGFPVEVACMGCPPTAPDELCACETIDPYTTVCVSDGNVGGMRGAGITYSTWQWIPGNENNACKIERDSGPFECGAVDICATIEISTNCAPAQHCAFRAYDTCYSSYEYSSIGDCPDGRTCIVTLP